MDLITFASYALIAIALAPLLCIGLYVVISALGFHKTADRLLDVCGSLFIVQGITGGAVNLLGGLAICALGIWGASHAKGMLPFLAIILVPFGLWRSWRGFCLLKSLY